MTVDASSLRKNLATSPFGSFSAVGYDSSYSVMSGHMSIRTSWGFLNIIPRDGLRNHPW